VYIGRAGKGQDGYLTSLTLVLGRLRLGNLLQAGLHDCARPALPFGNPFRIGQGESRGATLEKFRVWFYKRLETDPEYKRRIHELKGKTLGCFCKPHPCHGDIIAEYLDSLDSLEDKV
jgi:hypothetical protein